MLNNNTTNNTTSRKRMVVVVAVLALLLLCGVSRALYLSATNEYQMVLNGDAEVEILQNTEYTDDGVTFYEEGFFGGKKPVSAATQAQLEDELEITGLDTLDVSVCGDNTIEYRYDDQMLQRLVKVVTGGQQSPDDNHGQTGKPNGENTPGGESNPGGETGEPGDTKPTDNLGGNGNNGDQTTENTEPGNKVYHLSSNVTYNNAYFVYDGNNHTMTVRNLPEGIIPVYTGNTNIWAGTYDTKVEFVLSEAMQKTYSSVEPAFLTAKMTIRQATPQYEVPTNLTATVGQTLRDVKSQLPKGFSFEAPLKTSVGAEGINVFKVTFTPDDTDNYKTVTGINVQITVSGKGGESHEKLPFHLPSNVTFDSVTRTYSGYPNSIYVQNLPSGIIPVYTGNSQINAGTYEVTVTFMLSDELKKTCSNVEPASMTVTLTILKATPKYTVPENLTATEGDTLRSVKLPKGFSFQDPLTTSVGTVGTHIFKVTFTPEDTRNYETVTDIEILIRVKPKSGGGGGSTTPEPDDRTTYYLPSDVKYEDLTVTYNGKEWVLVVKGVPTGINVSYLNNKGTDAGTYKATAVFELSASMLKKYSSVSPATMTATLTINQATPTGFKVPTGLEATENTTLSNVSLGDTHFRWKNPNENVGAASNKAKGFTAIYTPSDKNYVAVEVTVYVKVKASNPDPGPGPGPGPVTKETPKLIGGKTEFTFEEGKVDNDTILEGWKAIDSNNHEVPGTFEVKKVGDKYTVVFTPADPDRYTTASKDVTVTEKKPEPPAKETPTVSKGQTAFEYTNGTPTADIAKAIENQINNDPNWKATDSKGNTVNGTFKVTYDGGKYIVSFEPTETDKYNDTTVSGDLTVTEKKPEPPVKETPTVTAPGGNTIFDVYTDETVDKIIAGWTATAPGIANVPGTFSVKEIAEDTYVVVFTPNDSSKYETVETGVTINFQPTKKPTTDVDNPTATKPTVTAPGGNTIFDVYTDETVDKIIAGWTATAPGIANVPGTFSVKEIAEDTYVVVFTPNDSSKYETVETGVTINFQPTKKPTTDVDNPTATKPTVTAPDGNTIFDVYTDETVDKIIAGWTATAPGIANVPGTFSVKEIAEDTYVVVFTPNDSSKYETVETGVTINFQPTKKPTTDVDNPTATKPTVTAPDGNTIFDVYTDETVDKIVAGWTASVDGKFTVKEIAENIYAVVFTPDDSSKYETVETGVTINFQPTTKPKISGTTVDGEFSSDDENDGETGTPATTPTDSTAVSAEVTKPETTEPFVPTPAPVNPSTNNVDGVETGIPDTTVTESQVENKVAEGTPENPESTPAAEDAKKDENEEKGEKKEEGEKADDENAEGEGQPQGEEPGEFAEGDLDGEAA